MNVANGPVECDWRVDITDCGPYDQRVMSAVLLTCIFVYLILAGVGYGIILARRRYGLTPPGPIIDFNHPGHGIRPKPIESFVWFSIAGLLVRSVSIIFVILDAFPRSDIIKELLSEVAVCFAFPAWASFLIGIWYATPKLSSPGDSLMVKVPRPRVINTIFFYLLFGPFLVDLPSVISSGIFLRQEEFTSANIAIAIHFISLGAVLLLATGLFFFTLNQLAAAISAYAAPTSDFLTNFHIGTTPPALDGSGGQEFILSPVPAQDRQEDEFNTSLAKVRTRLLNIRTMGTMVLLFYVLMYVTYGIARPQIHGHLGLNVLYCICFNLDPGIPTLFAYFIANIKHHIKEREPVLQQVYSSNYVPPRPRQKDSGSGGCKDQIIKRPSAAVLRDADGLPSRPKSFPMMLSKSSLAKLPLHRLSFRAASPTKLNRVEGGGGVGERNNTKNKGSIDSGRSAGTTDTAGSHESGSSSRNNSSDGGQGMMAHTYSSLSIGIHIDDVDKEDTDSLQSQSTTDINSDLESLSSVPDLK